jgi:hypothetical protein
VLKVELCQGELIASSGAESSHESVTPSRVDRISESECHETPEITAEQLADTTSDTKLSIG